MRLMFFFAMLCVTMLSSMANSANAALVAGGNATLTFNNNSSLFSGGGGPLTLDRFYGPTSGASTTTRDDVVAGLGGGDSIVVPGSGLVPLGFAVNGSSVLNPTGRSRQSSNLDADFGNVLATWSAAERIGIDGALRTTTALGVFTLADFSLVNNFGALTVVNNLDFSTDVFTVGTPVFTNNINGFSVAGDLLVSSSLSGFLSGFGAVVPTGTNIGSFSLSATAVPEPSSLVLLAALAGGIAWRNCKRRRESIRLHLDSHVA